MKDEVQGAEVDELCQLVSRKLLVKLAIPFGIQRVAHVCHGRITLEELWCHVGCQFIVLVLHKASYGMSVFLCIKS